MKQILLTIASIFLINCSFGQFTYGFKGGLNLANIEYEGENNYKECLNFYSGILTQMKLTKRFNVKAEFLYSAKGHKFSFFENSGTLSLKFLSFPVLAEFSPIENLSFYCGPEFNFLIKAISKFDGNNNNVTEYFKKFDLAIDIGTCYTFFKKVGIEVRYSKSVKKNIADITIFDPAEIDSGRMGKNKVFQFGLIYRLIKKIE